MATAINEAGATEAVEVESRALAPVAAQAVMELSADDIVNRLEKIQDVQRRAMKPKIDYGTIPGTGSKPTLLKAGAEKLCVLFRLDAQFETQQIFDGPHLTATTKCVIYHQATGQRLGAATALCSSKESKYAYRKGSRKCPQCGKEAIIKGKAEYGGGWICFKKKDGCGAKFADDDASIIGQAAGRIANENVADEFPTVLRMAEKRALIAAVRLVTGASAIFDEPMSDAEPENEHPSDDAPAINPFIKDGDKPVPLEKTASPQQRAKLWMIVKEKFGAVVGKEWLETRLESLAVTTKTMTPENVKLLTQWVLEAEVVQPEPAMEDQDIDY